MTPAYRPRPRGRATLALAIGVAIAVAACQGTPTATPGATPTAATAVAATGAGNTKAAAAAALGWSDATHGKGVAPAYDVAFPQGKVSEFRIVIEPSDWEAMMADMTKLFGARGAPGRMGGGPGNGVGRTARPM